MAPAAVLTAAWQLALANASAAGLFNEENVSRNISAVSAGVKKS